MAKYIDMNLEAISSGINHKIINEKLYLVLPKLKSSFKTAEQKESSHSVNLSLFGRDKNYDVNQFYNFIKNQEKTMIKSISEILNRDYVLEIDEKLKDYRWVKRIQTFKQSAYFDDAPIVQTKSQVIYRRDENTIQIAYERNQLEIINQLLEWRPKRTISIILKSEKISEEFKVSFIRPIFARLKIKY